MDVAVGLASLREQDRANSMHEIRRGPWRNKSYYPEQQLRIVTGSKVVSLLRGAPGEPVLTSKKNKLLLWSISGLVAYTVVYTYRFVLRAKRGVVLNTIDGPFVRCCSRRGRPNDQRKPILAHFHSRSSPFHHSFSLSPIQQICNCHISRYGYFGRNACAELRVNAERLNGRCGKKKKKRKKHGLSRLQTRIHAREPATPCRVS